MVYVVGTIGFIFGFLLGQAALLKLLRDVPMEKIRNDKNLRFRYGLLNWIFAAVFSIAFVYLYRLYV